MHLKPRDNSLIQTSRLGWRNADQRAKEHDFNSQYYYYWSSLLPLVAQDDSSCSLRKETTIFMKSDQLVSSFSFNGKRSLKRK